MARRQLQRVLLAGGMIIVLLIGWGGAAAQDSGAHLIQPGDLVYQGAFRLPADPEGMGWEYGGEGLAYYPDGDPDGPDDGYPGSLFGTGHDWNQYVGEISIPVPVVSPGKNADDLNTATNLQPFADIRGNMFGELEQMRAALEYLPPQGDQTTGKLYFAWGEHFQEESYLPSHGWADLDLANPQVAGPWIIAGQQNYVTNDYLFAIPPEWAEVYTPGMGLITGRYREGGQGASGPALVAIGPWNAGNPPPPDTEIAGIPLLMYDDFFGPPEHKLDGYHESDNWSGGAWLTAGDRAAVVVVGTKGHGEYWYGFANGVVWEEPYPDVPEYPYDDRGWWSTEHIAEILFYDPGDLAAVVQGEMALWEPQPYARLPIEDVLFRQYELPTNRHTGGVTFDRARGLLYVFEPLAVDGEMLIHVWRVGG